MGKNKKRGKDRLKTGELHGKGYIQPTTCGISCVSKEKKKKRKIKEKTG